MTDRPFNLSPHQVRAALDGRLSRVSVMLKPQAAAHAYRLAVYDPKGAAFWANDVTGVLQRVRLPFGPGDRMWVREAWRVGAWDWNNAQVAVDYCDGPRKEWLAVGDDDMRHRLIDQSRADAKKAGRPLRNSYYEYSWSPGDSPCRWRSSIHMPRWASRLTLTVTAVTVQRVQDINEDDATAEGIELELADMCILAKDYSATPPAWFYTWPGAFKDGGKRFCEAEDVCRASFRTLWDSIHGPGAWERNDWIAAATVAVRKGNIDA